MTSLAEPVVERLLDEFETGVVHLRNRRGTEEVFNEPEMKDLILDFCFCSRLIRTDLRTVGAAKGTVLAKRAVSLFQDAVSLLDLPPNHNLAPYVQNIKERAELLRTEFAIK